MRTQKRKNRARKSSIRRSRDWTRIRLKIVALFFLLGLGGLWGRAFYLQVYRGPELAVMAQRQYWTSEEVRGKRGEIYDRNGVLLAKSVEIHSVYARPHQVDDPRGTARELARILNQPEREIYSRLRHKKRFVWIARKVGDLPSKKLVEADLPGIHQVLESERLYPQGHLAGQLLGFVGLDNTGLEGVELSFDTYLREGTSKPRVQRDARGGILHTAPVGRTDSLHGRDLKLTLDARLQYATEEALAHTIRQNKAKSGMGLVVEVSSGDILAWAVYPFFDPNSYKGMRPSQWRNKIAMDVFEPGSTMKPFLIAAALEEKICEPDSIFFCENGRWEQKGYTIDDTHEYGWLGVNRIISYSSNIGAAKIGLALGARRYYDFLRAFGFGERTMPDLPGESAGLLRSPETWYPVDLATASFGQGIAVTALQLAQGYLCLAREGAFTPLRIVKDPAKETPPGRQVVSAQVARQVLSMMQEVVEDGTGTNAAIRGISLGGKTGTAQKASTSGGYGEEYISSFIALAPALDPKYLVLIIVDEPQTSYYAGTVAAPFARDIILQTLIHRGEINPQPPTHLVSLTPASSSGVSNTGTPPERIYPISKPEPVSPDEGMPDLRGLNLRQAMELLLERGIVPTLEGTGVFVERQSPSPGQQADQSQCRLWLTDSGR